MSWRFKASKYKNATPVAPKPEHVIRDLAVGSYMSRGNYVAASAAFMAFNWDASGSNLAVLPIDAKGRQNKTSVPLIYAHPDFVTDFNFSPFDDGLLATGSQDATVKLWKIPEGGMPLGGISTPIHELPAQQRRIETLDFHPAADHVLATSSFNNLVVWDLVSVQDLITFDCHEDEVQSVSWQLPTGQLLATQCKDKMLRLIDPRSGKCVNRCDSHQGFKDSKVVWLSDSNRLLTTGFGADRSREVTIRDTRKLAEPQKHLPLDVSSGILVPHYDPDTNMCFLAGKGDRNIQFVEISNKDPFIVEGLRYSGEQTKGSCLVPKRAMNVMEAEVNRILQLCDSSIVPITWQVPRKSYREYHADIFPKTNGYVPGMTLAEWWAGGDRRVPQIDLDLQKRPKPVLTNFAGGEGAKPSSSGEIIKIEISKTDSSSQEPPKVENLGQAQENSNGHIAGKEIVGPSSSGTNEQAKESLGKVKPNPLPRHHIDNGSPPDHANRPATSASSTHQKPSVASPKPQPRSSNVNGQENGHSREPQPENGCNEKRLCKENADDSFAMLRRQPSIKDRKKLLEANINRNLEISDSSKRRVTPHRGNSFSGYDVMQGSRAELPENGEGDQNDGGQQATTNTAASESKGPPAVKKQPEVEAVVLRRQKSLFDHRDESALKRNSAQVNKRPVSKMFGRVCKFKHLKGDILLRGRFDNLKDLCKTVPAECNIFHANVDRIAVPLSGPGGRIAVFETKRSGRIPDSGAPVLINGATAMDFCFNPFNNSVLAVGCDDGLVRFWTIPEGGLAQATNKPDRTLVAHSEKVQIVKFHPLASDVLLTAGFDKKLKIWDLCQDDEVPRIELEGHEDQLFSAEWSQDGRRVATVCRDGRIRIFEPRRSSTIVCEGGEIVPKKGARVLWVLDDSFLIVTGFSRQSERQVMMFDTKDLKEVNTVVLDVSPTILIPYYDSDSSTLFVTGKGESTVTTFEVGLDAPHLFPLSPYKPSGLHQGFAFLRKNACNVKNVEFAKAYRLTNTTIEPISFTVPRVKTNFFQDDLFPPTRVMWKPTLGSAEWFSGSDRQPERISLQPKGMKPLSGNDAGVEKGPVATEAATEKAKAPVYQAARPVPILGGQEPKEVEANLQQSISNMIQVSDKLEQDEMEGLEEEEWDED